LLDRELSGVAGIVTRVGAEDLADGELEWGNVVGKPLSTQIWCYGVFCLFADDSSTSPSILISFFDLPRDTSSTHSDHNLSGGPFEVNSGTSITAGFNNWAFVNVKIDPIVPNCDSGGAANVVGVGNVVHKCWCAWWTLVRRAATFCCRFSIPVSLSLINPSVKQMDLFTGCSTHPV